jgi:uncharacterized protein with NAD-binding domain and iron-sulfur cluster
LTPPRIRRVIGAGWAGLAAAVAATRAGHSVTVLEAARQPVAGRAARRRLPDGTTATLDNGQHILIGAYVQTLALMREVGVDPAQVLLRLPLTLRFPMATASPCRTGARRWTPLGHRHRARLDPGRQAVAAAPCGRLAAAALRLRRSPDRRRHCAKDLRPPCCAT